MMPDAGFMALGPDMKALCNCTAWRWYCSVPQPAPELGQIRADATALQGALIYSRCAERYIAPPNAVAWTHRGCLLLTGDTYRDH